MPAYTIEVIEHLRRTYTIHARDRHEAWSLAKRTGEWQDNGDTAQRIDFEVVDVSSEAGVDEMQAWRDRQEAS